MCFGGSKKSAPAPAAAPKDLPDPNNQAANNADQQRRQAITANNQISSTTDTLGNPAGAQQTAPV